MVTYNSKSDLPLASGYQQATSRSFFCFVLFYFDGFFFSTPSHYECRGYTNIDDRFSTVPNDFILESIVEHEFIKKVINSSVGYIAHNKTIVCHAARHLIYQIKFS